MKEASSYHGSAKKYINEIILPQLPISDRLVQFYYSLNKLLERNNTLRIIRKCSGYNSRGALYKVNGQRFTVTDNEAALWIYREALFGTEEFSFSKAIEKELFPKIIF